MTVRASHSLRDANLRKSDAMPAAAATTVNGTAIDQGSALTARGARLADCELQLTMPALTATMVPDTKTMTYSIEMASDAAFSSPTVLWSLVKTGAESAGVAADTFRQKLPTNCLRYVRAKAVSGANCTDASSVSMVLELLF